MVWRANSRAVPLVEVISEGSVWKSRVFCRRVVIIFLLRKSTTKTRRTRRKTRRNQCESVSSVLILFLSGRRSLRHERLLVNSLGAQASLPAGLGKGPSGRSKQAGMPALPGSFIAFWKRCVPYETGHVKRAGRKDPELLQSPPMSPSKAVVKRNVAKATLQKPWKTEPSC